jgi:hypothetical protein
VIRLLLLLGGLALASCAAVPPSAPKPAREVHGMADAFTAPGVALAWGVLRGADEAATVVVMRIVTQRGSYPWLAVAGSDPFTKSRWQVMPATRSADVTDVRAPRSHFAEFPRTEVRFYESAAAAQQDRPALIVFFLGVPDTTPEFTTDDKLQSYLRDRVARLNPSG